MESFGGDVIMALPLVVLLATGLVLMLLDGFKLDKALPVVAALGLVASIALALPNGAVQPEHATMAFGKLIMFGGTFSLVHIAMCAIGLFALFFIDSYFTRVDYRVNESYALLVFAIIGMSLLASGNDLLIIFIGLETMSICFYIMAALFKKDARSTESGYKYFLLGAFASGFLVYGIALLYGLTGTTAMDVISEAIFNPNPDASIVNNLMFYPAIGLILIGFLFKVAAFPFHTWTPDVYTGAPTPFAGFMATGGKFAAFVALAFFVLKALPSHMFFQNLDPKAYNFIAFAAIASMLYGNIVAIQQRNIKRMLAYSSIAHSGYLLLGILSGPEGYMAVIFYLMVYGLMTLGAFGVISMVETKDGGVKIKDWRGLGKKQPILGGAMAIFMFSLAGLPPLGGFIGKYLVFGSAIKASMAAEDNMLLILAIAGIATSVVGLYYYLRVIREMFFLDDESETEGIDFSKLKLGTLPQVGIVVMALLLLLIGVYPSLLFEPLNDLYAGDGFITILNQ